MNKFTALALLASLFACSSHTSSTSQGTASPAPASPLRPSQAVTLRPSTLTFKQADASCAGALGSIMFAMGHVRAHAATGVSLSEPPESTSGIATMTFSDKANGRTATVSVNAHNRSVSGRHITVKSNLSVACIEAE
jgi:hypothetical protein